MTLRLRAMTAEGLLIWTADRALAWGGLGLLVIGTTAFPWVLPLGWTAVTLAFFAWVAEWNGIALPRPGRIPIRTAGCWQTPMAFTVRHGKSVLLFARDTIGCRTWSDEYTVREQPYVGVVDPRWELPLTAASEWSFRGRAPVGALHFEHHERVTYVGRRSLERALAQA